MNTGLSRGSGAEKLPAVASSLTFRDRLVHILARCGVNRSGWRVAPGIYALGMPTSASPIFVSANYALSFNALRSSLRDISSYILVLDTKGINVWCAAGKGTFGTEEVVRQIESTGLRDIVAHRSLILPQLGAPGVSAHEVKRRTGFAVEYGPVRAADLPEYLRTREASPALRRVHFSLRDRLTLIPVEVVGVLISLAVLLAVRFFFRQASWTTEAAVALLAGAVLFPILLPWIPTTDFSTKGFILGGVVALPFAAARLAAPGPDGGLFPLLGSAAVRLLTMPPITAFVALNFTGSTTFTSRSGVRREIFKYIPIMAWCLALGLALFITLEILGH